MKTEEKDEVEDFFPQHEQQKTYQYASMIIKSSPETTTYADLTSRFPHVSSRGNKYIFVMYDFDSNLIQGEAIKNRQAKTLGDAWKKLHTNLTRHGHPTRHFYGKYTYICRIKII